MPQGIEDLGGLNLHYIPRAKRDKLLGVIAKHLECRSEVILAVAYGSFIGDKPFRDIDIAVYSAGVEDAIGYELLLERGLSNLTGYPVDVRLLNSAPPWFTKKVLGEGMVLTARKPFIVERLYLKAIDEEQVLIRGREHSASRRP